MYVTVCDVGPRDGLQNDREILSPGTRAELCDRLAATGLPRIEAGSFVNPERVPQMAGTEEVFAALHRRQDVVYAALALNVRGVERALAAGADELHLAYPLSDTFCARNQGMTLAEGAAAPEVMIGQAHDAGLRASVTPRGFVRLPVRGCGRSRERDRARRANGGVRGRRDHARRHDRCRRARASAALLPTRCAAGGRPIGLHLHNTRNNGYANADAGLEHGATVFDASIGGLGGCPFAPRATGNVATEDLIYLLDGEGVQTGVDLAGLIDTSEWLADVLGRDLPGLVYRAGPFVPAGA